MYLDWKALNRCPVILTRYRIKMQYNLVSKVYQFETAICYEKKVQTRLCLVAKKFCKIFQISRHIKSLDTCMKH
jgi:hypothetical protein